MSGKKNILPLKKEFPAIGRKISKKAIVYLDSACTALKMKSAAKEQSDFLLKLGACAGKRSAHLLSRKVDIDFCSARKAVAGFIGAKSQDEIVFTSGTTEAANLVAMSFPFYCRNEVILSPLEHNSVFLPFYRLSKQGKIKLKIIPLKDFKPDFNAYKKLLSAKTALVCITHASNIFGGIVDIKKFINAAHKKGAKVFIDDAQYIPTHKENVSVLNADMLAFSGHKMGAPFGTGVLYIKKSLFRSLNPSKLGGGTVKKIIRKDGVYKVDFLKNNAVYEAGIQNYSGIAALKRSFELLHKIGYQNIRAHIQDIIRYACLKLSSFKEIKILGEREDLQNGSIISFVCENIQFSIIDFNIFLNEYSSKYFVAVRCGRHCADLAILNSGIKSTVRLSFFIYSSKRDIDIFCGALKKYLKSLS
ncbi:MAG: aminotransferase class V-fold PLP-dependent enzyme [Elusimicrobia bacterium]|nr:aminotransferase class V-fold PLP-dependent enzyme [Elusimicrobiota bacterium]